MRRTPFAFTSGLLLVSMLCLSACKDDNAGICGNNKLNTGETCDGSEFGGSSCEWLGYEGGILFCSSECQVIETECWGCGNGQSEQDEECDGEDFRGLTCSNYGFTGGELTCNADCTITDGLCTSCGNELLEPGEQCETDDLLGETCETLGYTGGILDCDGDCQLDISACEVPNLTTCDRSGTRSATFLGEVTCPDEIGEIRWDWYTLPVRAADCVNIQVDNGQGAADLRAMVIDAGGTYFYGNAADYSQLDDESPCNVEPWNGFACPEVSVRAVTSGEFLILVSQVGYLVGGEPGDRACYDGLAEYSLFVAINGRDATTLTLVQDDQPLE